MELEYKPDWEQAKANLAAWWAGEDFGRCAFSVTSPRADAPNDPPPAPSRVEDRWMDIDYRVALCDWSMRRTFYGGEAVPNWSSGYAGWNAIPAYLGCPITLDDATGWWDPILTGERLTDHDPHDLVVDTESFAWRRALDMLRAGAESARGKCIVGVGAFGGCGDTLAALRDTMRLLYDVTDAPECVRDFELYLMRQWTQVYDVVYGITREVTEGSTCWNDIWAPGKYYVAQCDFSYMISPRMFRELFIPALEEQMRFLDYCVYHVDGIGSYAHVPALCELPRLRALQIIPGAGKPTAIHWMDMLREIQDAGKGLELYLPPEEVQTAIQHLRTKDLFIRTSCATEEDARALLRQVGEWCH